MPSKPAASVFKRGPDVFDHRYGGLRSQMVSCLCLTVWRRRNARLEGRLWCASWSLRCHEARLSTVLVTRQWTVVVVGVVSWSRVTRRWALVVVIVVVVVVVGGGGVGAGCPTTYDASTCSPWSHISLARTLGVNVRNGEDTGWLTESARMAVEGMHVGAFWLSPFSLWEDGKEDSLVDVGVVSPFDNSFVRYRKERKGKEGRKRKQRDKTSWEFSNVPAGQIPQMILRSFGVA